MQAGSTKYKTYVAKLPQGRDLAEFDISEDQTPTSA